MLNICILSIIMLFCVIGIYFCAKEIVSILMKNNTSSQIIIEVHNNANNVENVLRSALSANPNSDIIIIDKSQSKEIKEILLKFSNDNSRIHIQTAPEK